MSNTLICCPPENAALTVCGQKLRQWGLNVTHTYTTDATYLILPVPSAPKDWLPFSDYAESLTVCGGKLEACTFPHVVDFLNDPHYLAQNAAITAQCALQMIREKCGDDLSRARVLLLGWGRIGKCLAQLLRDREIDTSVAARKETDLAMIHALGYHAVPLSQMSAQTDVYHVVVNTIPVMVLPHLHLRPDAIAIELASSPGMSGAPILSARGLPGKMAPEQSGELIARSFIRLVLRKEDAQ